MSGTTETSTITLNSSMFSIYCPKCYKHLTTEMIFLFQIPLTTPVITES